MLKNKTIFITGGSRGIGHAIAVRAAADGANIVIAAKTTEPHPKLPGTIFTAAADVERAGGKALAVATDIRDEAQVDAAIAAAVDRFGGIDILINNAGGLVRRVPIAEVDDAFFDEVIDLNVRSVVMATAAVTPHMRRAGRGNIINVTSIAARNGGGAGAAMYASAKGFVSTFTRGIAKELVKDNIRVNAVSPGVITTPFHERYSTPQMLETFKGTIPMGRLGTADECAGAFVYLASDALSGYVTGQIIEVNGGQYMP